MLCSCLLFTEGAYANYASSCQQIVVTAAGNGLDVGQLVNSIAKSRKLQKLPFDTNLMAKLVSVMHSESSGRLSCVTNYTNGKACQRNHGVLQLSYDMMENYASRGIQPVLKRYTQYASQSPQLAAELCGAKKDPSVYAKLAKSCPNIGTPSCFISWIHACPALSFEITIDSVYGKTCEKPIYKQVKVSYQKKGKTYSRYISKVVGKKKVRCEEAYFQTWKPTVPLCKTEIKSWSSNTRLGTRINTSGKVKYSGENKEPNFFQRLFLGAGRH